MDTIFAPATPPGKSGVAVVRVSGPRAHEVVRALAGDVPEPRRASLRRLRDRSGAVIDEALVLVFAPGGSFTGEPSAEFQLHGSPAVVARMRRVLLEEQGLRLAEPGEFTRRALENERLDIAQVEGLADLIEAETELQRRLALRVFSGEMRQRVESWRERLIRAMALVEAVIDFADEEVPEDVSEEVTALLEDVRAELTREIEGVRAAERLREGFEVAILGRPNAGKSTLLNRLAGREAALTSEIAGTTRDVIEVRIDLDGLPVTFLDTAGLRETDDVVEAMGVRRALERARAADLRIFLQVEDEVFPELRPGDIVVAAKADLRDSREGVSGLTGEGVDRLLDEVKEKLGRIASLPVTATRERHRQAMQAAVAGIDRAVEEVRQGEARLEIAGEELRAVVASLSGLVGYIDVEHVLDEIFSRFCLGK
ncbi:tRNA modification GTPase [Meinhardsimonia xiamenensis]|jgi:tRNA modification GTPase|uniref:tRNA modification GTPase MnmE n=1 Tax=Meinhardsimonia xiamenensis TaxID=990712 RepID=A0A1G8Y6K3_9RHOB|nr:tRNA uridine-5-carboxymethylaminomethyl(34) synthesis GTPase MnmE [Meinhardsimonia xiamenensis]PRX37172.1 tRNA modification GTPase [Meinhardsimonia xiamenensis]SDJ98024.1 tRNA modification GTPase [Meinhardsimonia xiamenensis]